MSSSAALVVFGIGSAVVPIAGTGALFRAYPASAARLGARCPADRRPARRRHRRRPLPDALRARRREPDARGLGRRRRSERRVVCARPAAGGAARRPAARRRARIDPAGARRADAARRCGLLHRRPAGASRVPRAGGARVRALRSCTAAVAYFGVNVAADGRAHRLGLVADRGGGSRRVRTLVEVGVVASVGAARLRLRAPCGRSPCARRDRASGSGARLERARVRQRRRACRPVARRTLGRRRRDRRLRPLGLADAAPRRARRRGRVGRALARDGASSQPSARTSPTGYRRRRTRPRAGAS